MIRPSILAAAALLAAGCASSPTSSIAAEGTAVRISLMDYRTQAVFELVNESHTDAVEYYSTPRSSATRKVQTDDMMEGLVVYLEEHDFNELAMDGGAPRIGGENMLWSLEVESPNGSAHVLSSLGTSIEDKELLNQLRYAFLQTYNSTAGFQSVQVEGGQPVFRTPDSRLRK